MLSSFRKKLNSVIQESISLSENLSSQIQQNIQPSLFGTTAPAGLVDHSHYLYKKADDYGPSHVRSDAGDSVAVPRQVNLNAGSRILDYNQEVWADVRSLNVKNAALAAEFDERIMNVTKTCKARLTSMSDLNVTLASIPNIVTHLKSCTDTIEQIRTNMAGVERKLMALQDLVEVLELQDRQLNRRFDMAMQREKKMAELNELREDLTTRHARNEAKHERSLKQIQLERQKVFDAEFQKDLSEYKEKGQLPSGCPMDLFRIMIFMF